MKQMKAETIARTLVLGLALLNQCLVMADKSPLNIAGEDIAQVISLAATMGSAIWAWWKNNSFTADAVKADEILKQLKEERRA